MGHMTFEEALPHLRSGRRIRREKWNWGRNLAGEPGGRWMQVGFNVAATPEDVLADDWRVLDDDTNEELPEPGGVEWR
jgi:hypothetical protein